MKKIIITGLLLLTTIGGFSQMHIDLRAGATASSFGNEHLKIGFRAGVGVEYLFNGRLGLRTGLFYSVKGATESSNPFNYSADKATRLSYIDLPVEAVYQFRIASKTYLSVHAGPYVACLVDSSKPADSDIAFRRWDAGVGLGFDIVAGRFIIGPEVQYGLTQLADSGGLHNTTYTLTLGYRF